LQKKRKKFKSSIHPYPFLELGLKLFSRAHNGPPIGAH